MTYDGLEVQLHKFLTLALDGGEWSASLPGRFIPGGPLYQLYGKLGVDKVRKRKIYAPARTRIPVVYPV